MAHRGARRVPAEVERRRRSRPRRTRAERRPPRRPFVRTRRSGRRPAHDLSRRRRWLRQRETRAGGPRPLGALRTCRLGRRDADRGHPSRGRRVVRLGPPRASAPSRPRGQQGAGDVGRRVPRLRRRPCPRRTGGLPDDRAAPGPTVVSRATLETVASWFDEIADATEMRRRLRPNLVLDDCPAFWEDRLFADHGEAVRVSIGATELFGVNPCQRCVVPSRDPDTGDGSTGSARRSCGSAARRSRRGPRATGSTTTSGSWSTRSSRMRSGARRSRSATRSPSRVSNRSRTAKPEKG